MNKEEINGEESINIDETEKVDTESAVFMKVDEVAKVLRIGRNKAYEAIRKGEIPSVKIDGIIRVTRFAFNKKFGLS